MPRAFGRAACCVINHIQGIRSESSVGGALGLGKWCHLLGLQPLHFSTISSGFHKHPTMSKLHFVLLMDIVKLNLNSVPLPIWQRNHFNCRGSVSRKLWSISLSLYCKSVSWTTAVGTGLGFALVRGKWSSPLENKLIECLWNKRIPPVIWFPFQFSSHCGSFTIAAMLYWKEFLSKEKFK